MSIDTVEISPVASNVKDRLIAIRCWSSNDYYYSFDYALIRVTAELFEAAETRRKIFEFAIEKDPALSSLEFYDLTPTYCSESDLEAWCLARSDSDQNPEWLRQLQDGSDRQELPEDFSFQDDDGNFRTECDRMVVNSAGIWWECIPKHSDIRVDTACILYAEFATLFL